jgi:hypothetical protein
MQKPAKLAKPEENDDAFNDMYGSAWTSPDDIRKNFYSTIETQEPQAFDDGKKGEKTKLVITLKGVKKPFVLNKTNALNLASVYGKVPANWVGKSVLVKKEMTNYQGKPMPCIRIYPHDPNDMGGDSIPI